MQYNNMTDKQLQRIAYTDSHARYLLHKRAQRRAVKMIERTIEAGRTFEQWCDKNRYIERGA